MNKFQRIYEQPAFNRGFCAAIQNIALTANPYPIHSTNWVEWNNGWNDALPLENT